MVRRNFKIGAIDAANVNVTANGFAATLTANADLSSNVSFSLPGTEGTSGQVLSTDGSGNLFFADSSASSGNTKAYVGNTFVSNTAVILEAGEGTSIQANADTNVISFSTAMSNITSQTLSVDGSANTFTLAKSVSNSHMVLVSYNGLLQTPAQYEVANTSLTISNTKPLLADSFIEVRYFDFFGFPGIASGGGGGGAAGGGGLNLSNVTYDSVSFSLTSEDTVPRSLAFSADGTKMYMIGTATDSVYQYSLSTAFDLSTASYDSVSFSVTSQESIPLGLTFNTDGTRMYIAGFMNDTVYQYNLTTGFDLSTAYYSNISFSVASQETAPLGLTFNADGTKMYLVGNTNDTVYQYSLSTGFNLSTASYDSVSFSAASQDTTPTAIVFNADGTKMYIIGQQFDTVYQYTLSTGFDLSTASYDSASFSVASQSTGPHGLAFSNDFTKMYIIGASNGSVFQYSTGL